MMEMMEVAHNEEATNNSLILLDEIVEVLRHLTDYHRLVSHRGHM